MNSERNAVRSRFSHIYVEKDISDHPITAEILSYFADARMIRIDDYRDVFNRSRQSHVLQKQHQNLILARKKDGFLYHASPVCQSFDNRYFYYSTSMMNCIYDCEYCFLKGMYPSGNLVVFVNLEDFFTAVEEKLEKHPVYLCVSYDTDMLALESIMHNGERWSQFALDHPDLSIEIRTKGTFSSSWKKIAVNDRVILAFTLSPESVSRKYEHGTPDLSARIAMIQGAMECGYPCRICFDPILVYPGWQQDYENMMDEVLASLDLSRIRDFSIGSFRISKDYMSVMRRQYPDSAVLQYPYVCDHGFYHLPDALRRKAEQLVYERLLEKVERERIYLWEDLNG